jgi:hypothetical protein
MGDLKKCEITNKKMILILKANMVDPYPPRVPLRGI